MPDSLRASVVLPVDPDTLYLAWIDGEAHAAMTGAPAESDPRVGGRFTAWEGYIEGTHLELVPGERIVQAWRSADFPEGASDSRLELRFEAVPGGCRLTLVHTEIPDGQGPGYEQGWEDYYFEPMAEHFSG